MTGESLRVLLVEDNPDHVHLIQELLWEASQAAYELTCTDRLASGLALLTAETFDILLLDLGLPDSLGLDTLLRAQQQAPAMPIILLTGLDDEALALEAVRWGAQDYLVKGRVDSDLLGRAILYAVERKRGEEEIRKRNRELTLLNRVIAAAASSTGMDAVLNTTCRELALALDVPQVAAALLDESRTRLHAVAEYLSNGRPSGLGAVIPVDGNSATQYLLEQGTPLAVIDAQADPRLAPVHDLLRQRGTASLLLVPLVAHDEVLGAIGLDAVERREFTTEEISLALNAAAAAAQAIENTRLFDQTQQRLQRLSALRSIDIAIATSLDLQVTLDVLLDQLIAQLGTDAADVLLLNRNTQTLEYAAGRGFRSDAIGRTSLYLGDGGRENTALQQYVVNIPNLRKLGAAFGRAELLAGEDFIAYYTAPLVAKGVITGLLELFHRAPFEPNPEWLDFLETLAAQAAIAIDNAILFDDLQRSNAELVEAYDTTLEGWVHALDLRDEETEGHTRRVTELTEKLAQEMGFEEAEMINLRRGALLHDIGKMGIPDSILLKPGPLSDGEWEIMRRHPVYAYELLVPIEYLRRALDIPYCHHEKWDGTGYPRQLQGERIPLVARIFAVVDVWDALRSDRPYRSAWPEQKVLAHIRGLAGTHFDPRVTKAFLTMMNGHSQLHNAPSQYV